MIKLLQYTVLADTAEFAAWVFRIQGDRSSITAVPIYFAH